MPIQTHATLCRQRKSAGRVQADKRKGQSVEDVFGRKELGGLIADLLHFSFTVSDIERSVAWYTDVLGLQLVHRQHQTNEYTSTLVGFEGADLAVALFKIPGLDSRYSSHILELIEYRSPRGHSGDLATNNVGVAHLALMVTDIHERYERLRQRGVVFVNPPVEATEGLNAGGWMCYVRDPDGITIEFVQPPPARLALILGVDSDVAHTDRSKGN